MKTLFKLFVSITLVMLATSCEQDEMSLTKETFAGTWEYTIEISFEGTNYNTEQSVSETKKFSGTFTWDENLDGWLEGDIEYSYLMGYIDNGWLGFTEDDFRWSENGIEYQALREGATLLKCFDIVREAYPLIAKEFLCSTI